MQTFEEVYEEHVWDVYGFIGYRVRSQDVAEDLTQATFERALKAWERFDPGRATAKTWLLAIARNILIDHYRRSAGRVEKVSAEPESEGGEIATESIDERALGPSPEIQAALGELGDREREVIALRFGGDMSGAEIADMTGLTLANVQQILSRSLRRMRTRLEAERESDDA